MGEDAFQGENPALSRWEIDAICAQRGALSPKGSASPDLTKVEWLACWAS